MRRGREEERRRGNTLVLRQGRTDGWTDGQTDGGRGVRGHRGGPVVSTFVIFHFSFFVLSGTFFGTIFFFFWCDTRSFFSPCHFSTLTVFVSLAPVSFPFPVDSPPSAPPPPPSTSVRELACTYVTNKGVVLRGCVCVCVLPLR